MAVPRGFVAAGERGRLLVREELRDELLEQGFDRPGSWIDRLAGEQQSAGRGTSAVLPTSAGGPIRLKQLRRGGLLAKLWRERFLGARRLRENLTIPVAMRERGVPTPAPAALLTLPGPPGFYRGWVAFDEIEGATDLAALFAAGARPAEDRLRAAMHAVWLMHGAGLEHRDLNLGNLLVRGEGVATEAWVIDLDGARWRPDGLGRAVRDRGLRRLERSLEKVSGGTGDPAWIRRGYASA